MRDSQSDSEKTKKKEIIQKNWKDKRKTEQGSTMDATLVHSKHLLKDLKGEDI